MSQYHARLEKAAKKFECAFNPFEDFVLACLHTFVWYLQLFALRG